MWRDRHQKWPCDLQVSWSRVDLDLLPTANDSCIQLWHHHHRRCLCLCRYNDEKIIIVVVIFILIITISSLFYCHFLSYSYWFSFVTLLVIWFVCSVSFCIELLLLDVYLSITCVSYFDLWIRCKLYCVLQLLFSPDTNFCNQLLF